MIYVVLGTLRVSVKYLNIFWVPTRYYGMNILWEKGYYGRQNCDMESNATMIVEGVPAITDPRMKEPMTWVERVNALLL